jgi:4-diphosphocytidyl-2C-methyl-D-erythritol kinase
MAGRRARKWIRRDESQWRALLLRFSGSGLTVSAFCERESVSTASFHRWRERIEEHQVGGEMIVPPGAPTCLDLGCV